MNEEYLIIREKFGSIPEFKKASKIFWSYRVSPLFTGDIAVKPQEYPYYTTYRDFIREEMFNRVI